MTNVLVFLTSIFGGSIGLAVVAMTILVKIILLPFSYATTKSQIAMKKIQPLMEDLKKQYPNKEEQAKKMMELYKEHNTNPLAGCLPLIIQLPIIIALYQVFLQGTTVDASVLYSFVHMPENISNFFLGINMTSKSAIIAILAGVTQYIQLRFSPSMQKSTNTPAVSKVGGDTVDMMENMQKSMKYTLPILITVFAWAVPAAVALYWVVTNVFTIAQEWWINKQLTKKTA